MVLIPYFFFRVAWEDFKTIAKTKIGALLWSLTPKKRFPGIVRIHMCAKSELKPRPWTLVFLLVFVQISSGVKMGWRPFSD